MTAADPLVSILMPCYNAAPWLRASLDSALGQTWPHKEIVVVDDGSTDESLAIARGYENRGVRIFPQPNAGASAARNRALRESRGALIQFLDADDLLSPRKIAGQVELLRRHPPHTVATCAWGRFSSQPETARFVDEAVFRDFSPLEFLLLAAETGAMMHPSAWLVPRAVAERAGGWNEGLTLNDDGEYFARVTLASSGIAFCPDENVRSYYRSGLPGSLSRRRDDRSRRSQFRSLELISDALRQREDSPRTRQARAALWTRFIHDYYPAPADLIAAAEAEVARLGGKVGVPAMGPKTRLAASVLGWRAVWRLKHRMSR